MFIFSWRNTYYTSKVGQLLVFAMYYSMFSDAVKNISGADAELEAQKVYTDRLLESLQMIHMKSREKK